MPNEPFHRNQVAVVSQTQHVLEVLTEDSSLEVAARTAVATDPPDQAAPGRRCPRCGGAVETVEVIVPRELRRRLCRRREPDTS